MFQVIFVAGICTYDVTVVGTRADVEAFVYGYDFGEVIYLRVVEV